MSVFKQLSKPLQVVKLMNPLVLTLQLLALKGCVVAHFSARFPNCIYRHLCTQECGQTASQPLSVRS